MNTSPEFDLELAHRHFSAACFNSCWELIEKNERTREEDEQMLLRAFASFWHWTQRPDCTELNRSIAYWQISRVYSLLGRADDAREYGVRCLEISAELEAFFLAYAYEALARAEQVGGNEEASREFLERAYQIAEDIEDEEERKLLLDDLKAIV